MSTEIYRSEFLSAAQDWVCDGYTLDVRYVAAVEGETRSIWNASINLYPIALSSDMNFAIESGGISIGQNHSVQKKTEILDVLNKATQGGIAISKGRLILPTRHQYDFYSEVLDRDRWFANLHLQVAGSPDQSASAIQLVAIDNVLRISDPPFDGLADAGQWLGLDVVLTGSNRPAISIRVSPPVVMKIDECHLVNDNLEVVLHAHPHFDVKRVGLAVRGTPGDGLTARKQIAKYIQWRSVEDKLIGNARVPIGNADNALVMLMIGTSTVQRQWFIDPNKARNNRLLAVQHFDANMKMIRDAVLESPDANKFERGIAALLFMSGFTPFLPLEREAPDLIVATPGGRLVVVECTIKTADVQYKMGLLVQRRGSLAKALEASGHPTNVSAALVCRLPRDQIAAHEADLRSHHVILVTGGELETAFTGARYASDPDKLLNDALAELARPKFLDKR